MKILLFTLEFPPFFGGVSNYYGNLQKHWQEPANFYVLNNNEKKLIKSWLWPHWLLSLIRLYLCLNKNNIGHILVGQLLPLGIAAYFIGRLTRTPYTIIIHGMDFTYAVCRPRKEKMTQKILRFAEHIICTNQYTADLVKNKYEFTSAKISVVHPGVDPEAAVSVKRQQEISLKYGLADKIILFSVGRLIKRKGFDKVIEAMSDVTRRNNKVYYFLAGDGPDKKYIYKCAQGVPNIIFLGKITEEDKWAWFNLCHIFIMPARMIGLDFEGFGIVYLEANICGKPVIASESGGVGDAVKGALTGITVDPNDAERIAGAILTLAEDPALRARLGEQGRARAVEEFNWEKQARAIYNLININHNL